MTHRFSEAIGIGALILAFGTAQAAAEEPVVALEPQFMTERGAQIALTKILDAIDAAVPALTPEQQEYVNREEAFRSGPGRVALGETYGARVDAFTTTKEFRLWRVHDDLQRLRTNLTDAKQLAGRPERFAVWSDIVVQMSFPSGLEVALRELHRMGVVDKNALGPAQGVSWLHGPLEGEVQILWPFWAETMWVGWCHEGILDATGASKLLKSTRPAPRPKLD
jgi:hypothetical protein